MLLFDLVTFILYSAVAFRRTAAAPPPGPGAFTGDLQQHILPYKGNEPLQKLVTWDSDSLYVRGERILIYSGEFHPFRLPVPSLWLDVFQKIKSMGYNCVSFYVHWGLLEGKRGDFSAEGVFAWEPFFRAAGKAGIYLLARPGPYINAEVSGGGFPGWLQRVKGVLRSADQDFLDATDNYVSKITQIIAKAQITNGGPVILFQPENEYSGASGNSSEAKKFPDPVYWTEVQNKFRKAGIVVPFITNDAGPNGYFSPDHPIGNVSVDIYGHDGYPLGFDCANPDTWPANGIPTNWAALHRQQSPSTPYSIVEFQGGAFDPWGGLGFEKCAVLVNHEYERVFYKNNFGFGVKIFNIYMTYGGTNWGNLGHPGGYTSYDYGSVITEDRQVTREKYSEAKLIANFQKVSPAYLTAKAGTRSTSAYTDNVAVSVTPLWGNPTNFYVIRHSDYSSKAKTEYDLNLKTSLGNITVPLSDTKLRLNGRDSKIYVTDYDIGGINLIYSTAEIFTWKKYDSKTVLVLYGDSGEHHELALAGTSIYAETEGTGVNAGIYKNATILTWESAPVRKIVKVAAPGGNSTNTLYIYLVDRNTAYNYWTLDLPTVNGLYATANPTSIIVKAGYLLRNATLTGKSLALVGDFNTSTPIEVIGGAPNGLAELIVNGKGIPFSQSNDGVVFANIQFESPAFTLPKLGQLQWKYIDSLPEIQSSYDDKAWVVANKSTTQNSLRALNTPISLYSSDYGFHAGTLVYRGRFTASGADATFSVTAQGGSAFGFSVWLDSTFLGSFTGYDAATFAQSSFKLPAGLAQGTSHVFTIVIDNMGLDENFIVGPDEMKRPRGILDYDLSGRPKTDITWKLTGNLGGEDYKDRVRGPLNEGGLYVERQGYHLPSPPTSTWADSKGPTDGITTAGIGFYAASLDLNMPVGYDIPLSFVFANSTSGYGSKAAAYRAQLFVNGYQFGKYVHNVGPQGKFPVPEGILNYRGKNWIAVSLWSLEQSGAKLDGFELEPQATVATGYGNIALSPVDSWKKRTDAY